MTTTLACKPSVVAMPRPKKPVEGTLRRYIYCIADCDEPKRFDCDTIGEGSRDVHAVVYNGVAAVVSPTAREKYAIDRRHMLAHQRVLEYVMAQGHTVLPVKFDTIAEAKNGMRPEQRIIRHVLMKRFDEFSSLLGMMNTRIEMGVKLLWQDMNAVFREIAQSSDEIERLRRRITHHSRQPAGRGNNPKGAQFPIRMKLGELVKNALEAKKKQEQRTFLHAIRDLVVDFRKNKLFGDQMFANLALLVEKTRIEALDRKLDELADATPARIKLKYVGPLPASNFINLVIKWDE